MTLIAPLALAAQRPGQAIQNAFLVQRKCDCGGGVSALSGECEECGKKGKQIQTKLAIGAADDAYEREADRIADQVVRGVGAPEMQGSPPRLQRLARVGAAAGTQVAPESVGRVLASTGRPIEPTHRASLERQFGRSFADVRIHADQSAAESAAEIGARAYAHGQDIVFAAGAYAPGATDGLRLLAHELAHVVQQSGDAGAPVQRDLAIEPQGINQEVRQLSEQDIERAIAVNKARMKNKKTLEKIRDVVGISPQPAVSDRDLALAVGRWQAAHGVAQDGQLGPITTMLLVEEFQAESEVVGGLKDEAKNLKKAFPKGTFLDIDEKSCGCKPELEAEIKRSDERIAQYSTCGADPANKTGVDIEKCVTASIKAKGGTVRVLGATSPTGAITLTGSRKGPCAKLLSSIDLAHEQIHSVHTGELKQQHGAGTPAFTKAFIDPADWVADEINSRNTEKSLATWALKVIERTCP